MVLLLRSARRDAIFRRVLRLGRAWLSSVAAGELYAGAVSRDDRREVVQFVSGAEFGGRLLTPTHEQWIRAGQLLARRSRLRGAMEPRDHLNDLLVLLSAQGNGARVVTANVRHFADWARIAGFPAADVVSFPAGL